MHYCGITYNRDYTITHRLYLFDRETTMMYCGDTIIKDIGFPSTFNYFKKINKNFFPIRRDKFNIFLLLNWQIIENSNFFDFIETHQIEEWIL